MNRHQEIVAEKLAGVIQKQLDPTGIFFPRGEFELCTEAIMRELVVAAPQLVLEAFSSNYTEEIQLRAQATLQDAVFETRPDAPPE